MELGGKIPERSQIPVEDTWALEDLYPSDDAWEQELETVCGQKDILEGFRGKLAEDPEALLAFLQTMEQTNVKPDR